MDPAADMFGGLSTYHYAYNNPIGYNDPLGLWGKKNKGGENEKKKGNEDASSGGGQGPPPPPLYGASWGEAAYGSGADRFGSGYTPGEYGGVGSSHGSLAQQPYIAAAEARSSLRNFYNSHVIYKPTQVGRYSISGSGWNRPQWDFKEVFEGTWTNPQGSLNSPNAQNGGSVLANPALPLGLPMILPILEGLGLGAIAEAIDRIATEANTNLANGVQYSLKTTKPGWYPVYEWGKKNPVSFKYLNAYDTWKIGETTQFDSRTFKQYRYSESWLNSMNLEFIPEFTGNEFQIYTMQQLKLLHYSINYLDLPPGNKGIQ